MYSSGADWRLISRTNSFYTAGAGSNFFRSKALVHSDIVVEFNRRMDLAVLNIKFKTV